MSLLGGPPACPCGCGLTVPPTHHRAKRPRIYAQGHACRMRAYRASPKGRARDRFQRRARETAVRGRVCRWCGKGDHQTRWSQCLDQCANCLKHVCTPERKKCGKCGGPFLLRRSRGFDVGCVRCNRD